MSFKELEEIIPHFKDLNLTMKIFYKIVSDFFYMQHLCITVKEQIVNTFKRRA